MWDDLRCLDQDFDIAKANKHHLKYLRKMRSECPHLPESLAKKLDLWERHFLGDLEATKPKFALENFRKPFKTSKLKNLMILRNIHTINWLRSS